jgi:hypothetical protein
MTQLVFPRHFAALGCCSILACAAAKLNLLPNAAASFVLYGVLHAAALVIALRTPLPSWRLGLFMVTAGALCLLTYRVGMFGRALAANAGERGLYLPLGASTVIGAASYAVAIRVLLGIHRVTPASVAAICGACLLATYLAAWMIGKVHGLGSWWLAVLWWFAFSGGLWLSSTRRRTRAAVP